MPWIPAWNGCACWIQTDLDIIRPTAAVRRKGKLQSVSWFLADWVQWDFLFFELCSDSEHAAWIYYRHGRVPRWFPLRVAKNCRRSFPARQPDYSHSRTFSWGYSAGRYWHTRRIDWANL